jgi:hypothetical protein
MTKSEFKKYLVKSSLYAFEFAKKYVNDELFSDFKYNLILNMSKDDDCDAKFDLYPEDNDVIKLNLFENEVVEVLCRKEKVPVWIDINILESSQKITTFNLICSGRYTNIDEELYYYKKGTGPFGIKSPLLPNNYIEGEKFYL